MQKDVFFTFPSGVTQNITLDAYGGEVVDTDQRSDTYISGGGSSMVYKGSGGGSVSVSSTVVVNRDVWLKEKSGREIHIRLNLDLPLRKGQVVYIIDVIKNGIRSPGFLYNASTKESYFLSDKEHQLFSEITLGKAIGAFIKSAAKFSLFFVVFLIITALFQFVFDIRSYRDFPYPIIIILIYGFYRFFIKKWRQELRELNGEFGVKKTASDVVKDSVSELINEIEVSLEFPQPS